MKTLGLALGSGGARGVCHVGFIQALEEEGIKIDYIAGCSMGAVIGACHAKGMSGAEMKEEIMSLKPRDLIDLSPGIVSRMSVLRSRKVKELLERYLGDAKIEDLKIPFRCVATDLYSGEERVFAKGPAAVAVQASCAIPAVFKPVKYDGGCFVDGGCLDRLPVKAVKDMGADVVVAVDALKNTEESADKVGNILSMILRLFDVMDKHMTKKELEIEASCCDLLVQPEMKGMSQYLIKDLDLAFDDGYKEGKAAAPRIRELLA